MRNFWIRFDQLRTVRSLSNNPSSGSSGLQPSKATSSSQYSRSNARFVARRTGAMRFRSLARREMAHDPGRVPHPRRPRRRTPLAHEARADDRQMPNPGVGVRQRRTGDSGDSGEADAVAGGRWAGVSSIVYFSARVALRSCHFVVEITLAIHSRLAITSLVDSPLHQASAGRNSFGEANLGRKTSLRGW